MAAGTRETRSDDDARRKPAWRRWWPVGLIVAAMVGAYASGAHRWLSVDALVAHRAWLGEQVADHLVPALLAYGLAYVAAVALSLPGAALLSVVGGLLFGTLVGSAAAVIAATLGAVLIFLVARTAFGEGLRRKAGAAVGKLLDGFRSGAASYLLFLRLVPVFPFWLVNLAAAIGGVGLPVFAWTTLVGIVPGTVAFASFGAGLDSVIAAQQAAREACTAAGRADCRAGLDLMAVLTPQLIGAFVLLGCVALIPVAWRAIKARRGEQGTKAS